MHRILPILVLFFAMVVSFGQTRRFFAVDEQKGSQTVHLRLDAKSGNYIIEPHKGAEMLNVISNEQQQNGNYMLHQQLSGSVHRIDVKLDKKEETGFARSLSQLMFGDDEEETTAESFWKLSLSESKPYRLYLDYAVGNANADLSGLSIQYLNINTGNADVEISYRESPNKMVMDTFHVNVDMGSLVVRNLSRARSRNIHAEVGFGNALLDFSERPQVESYVHGFVGAGELIILLPEATVPVIVRVNDSWFSSVLFPDDFRQVDENLFANPAYFNSKAHALQFDLDCAMGRIILQGKSRN